MFQNFLARVFNPVSVQYNYNSRRADKKSKLVSFLLLVAFMATSSSSGPKMPDMGEESASVLTGVVSVPALVAITVKDWNKDFIACY